MVLLSVGMGVRGFEDVDDYFNPSKWEGTRLNRRAQELLTHVKHGRILTLAPIYPLEAGLAIYPAFSTGPFAWRVSPYIEANKAVRIGIVSPAMLGKLLEASPPAGVLVGFEEDDEEDEFNDYARKNGLKLMQLVDHHQIWVKGVDDGLPPLQRIGVGR